MARILYHVYALICTVVILESFIFVRQKRRALRIKREDVEEQSISEKQPVVETPAFPRPHSSHGKREAAISLVLYEKQPLFERAALGRPHPINAEKGEVFESDDDITDAEIRCMVAVPLAITWIMIIVDHVEWFALWESLKDKAVEAAEYSVKDGLVVYGAPWGGL